VRSISLQVCCLKARLLYAQDPSLYTVWAILMALSMSIQAKKEIRYYLFVFEKTQMMRLRRHTDETFKVKGRNHFFVFSGC